MMRKLLNLLIIVLLSSTVRSQVSLVKDICLAHAPSIVNSSFSIGNLLYFPCNSTLFGSELWRSDGTAVGTFMLKDIYPGETSSSPKNFCGMNGVLYFTAESPHFESQLWRTDGTESGTRLVFEFIFEDIPDKLANITNLTVVNNFLYFIVQNRNHAIEIWKSDGTRAGTTFVKSFPWEGLYSRSSYSLLNFNGVLFCSLNDLGVDRYDYLDLWRIDETETGTCLVNRFNGCVFPGKFCVVSGVLYCAYSILSRNYLWKSDGTKAGTVLVKEFRGDIESLINFNGTLYFSVEQYDEGDVGLWKTDGTTAGTVRVRKLNIEKKDFAIIGSQLFFIASDTTFHSPNYELWKSDGTESGTMSASDILPGLLSGRTPQLINFGGKLFFTANELGIFISNGTPDGTVKLKAKTVNFEDQNYNFISVLGATSNNRFFFSESGRFGDELWATDGTAEGTYLVSNIQPGTGGSYPWNMANLQNRLISQLRKRQFRIAAIATYGYQTEQREGQAS